MKIVKQNSLLSAIVILPLLASCQSNPHNVNVTLPKSVPEAKVTLFENAITTMGTMSSIYNDKPLRIMINEITDNTGTSVATSAEIPRDITAMVKSTLNAFGGNITFIPYAPNFMANTMNTGYSNFSNKMVPDVIVDGGITEFDRGLETKDDSINLDISATVNENDLGVDFEDSNKASLARVTLDFNLIDFQTFSGIPQMQAINTIKLNKAVKKDSIGFTILSSSFGVQGSVKKIQGRHAAVRLLVQLSMLQIVGKYQNIPYWSLMPGSVRDINLLNRVIEDYYSLPEHLRTARLQVFLALNGYPVNVTGTQDQRTLDAKRQVISNYNLDSNSNDASVFITVYENVPITRENKYKSRQLHQLFQQVAQSGAIASPVKKVARKSKPKKSKPIKEAAFAGKINLITNKKTYTIGEKMIASFTVDEPMFVRVSVISSNGSVATLFPNAFQNDNYCKPGIEYQIPPENNTEFSLDISEPKGTDYLRAIGSKKPIISGQVRYSPSGKLDQTKFKEQIIIAGTEIFIQ